MAAFPLPMEATSYRQKIQLRKKYPVIQQNRTTVLTESYIRTERRSGAFRQHDVHMHVSFTPYRLVKHKENWSALKDSSLLYYCVTVVSLFIGDGDSDDKNRNHFLLCCLQKDSVDESDGNTLAASEATVNGDKSKT